MSRKWRIAMVLVGIVLLSWSAAAAKIKKKQDSQGTLYIFNVEEGDASKPKAPPKAKGFQASPPPVSSPQSPALQVPPQGFPGSRVAVPALEPPWALPPDPALGQEPEPPQTEAPPPSPKVEAVIEGEAEKPISRSTGHDGMFRN